MPSAKIISFFSQCYYGRVKSISKIEIPCYISMGNGDLSLQTQILKDANLVNWTRKTKTIADFISKVQYGSVHRHDSPKLKNG